ncbi:hypothetical protein ACHQM5_030085 [Ranunculus cassubicifolius]
MEELSKVDADSGPVTVFSWTPDGRHISLAWTITRYNGHCIQCKIEVTARQSIVHERISYWEQSYLNHLAPNGFWSPGYGVCCMVSDGTRLVEFGTKFMETMENKKILDCTQIWGY